MEVEWFVPVLIFLARICDVSIGTVRMIFVISGSKLISAVLGFFEVIIWALAVSGVIKYLDGGSWITLIAYGAGFATGTLVGMTIEQRIAIGFRMVRIVNADRQRELSSTLRDRGYRVTRVDGTGRDGPVEIAFLVLKRRDLAAAMKTVQELAPDAFVTVERADRASGDAFRSGARPADSPGLVGLLRLSSVRK